jgi:hypothetical protein
MKRFSCLGLFGSLFLTTSVFANCPTSSKVLSVLNDNPDLTTVLGYSVLYAGSSYSAGNELESSSVAVSPNDQTEISDLTAKTAIPATVMCLYSINKGESVLFLQKKDVNVYLVGPKHWTWTPAVGESIAFYGCSFSAYSCEFSL